jgi:GNAT superfamily N-acetyltransferase
MSGTAAHGARVVIRPARPGDGAGCGVAWADAGRHMQELNPDVGREPDEDGLVEWFEQSLARDRPASDLWLVAVRAGQVVGFVHGSVEPPLADARWQLQRDLASPRLVVGALVVRADQRRSGAGTALMTAIEQAGRGQGAVVATLDTNIRSELSVPFYAERMAYTRRGVVFRKRLS